MQAIYTKILPATNTKPTRIKASCSRGSLVVSYDGLEGNMGQKHRQAAQRLIQKFLIEDEKRGIIPELNSWGKPIVTGGLENNDFVHCFVDSWIVCAGEKLPNGKTLE